MRFKEKTINQLAAMICGSDDYGSSEAFPYRSSSYLTRFFEDAETDFKHQGETRARWVSDVLVELLQDPSTDAQTPSDAFLRVIDTLMDQSEAKNEPSHRPRAMEMLNIALAREGFEAFYGDGRRCYLRRTSGNLSVVHQVSPHRPFSVEEQKQRDLLERYLSSCSEDQLIEDVLAPLLRQLGFQRITLAGHRDKALEYGKDLWMRYNLPTQHALYFGIQAKRGKIDAAGRSTGNVAEILSQAEMMIGHEIFDPESNHRVLVDHAFIIAGGEITKSARNWIGQRLDAKKRSQIMFMDRDDILNLYVSAKIPLPKGAQRRREIVNDDFPF